jgi:hypothetical protein
MIVLLLVPVAVGCGTAGSGEIVSETRQVGPFDRIEISAGVSVDITVDPDASPQVTSTYDDNLQAQIITTVTDGTLFIEIDGTVTVSEGGRMVTVSVPALTELVVDAGASVHGVGTADSLTLAAGGGARVDISEFVVQTMDVDVSGGADVTVNTTGAITGDVSGGAVLTIHGDPASRDLDVSAGARVNG